MVGGQSGQLPTRVSAEQKVPPGSSGAPHYHLPTQFKIIIYAPVICYAHSYDAAEKWFLDGPVMN